MAKSLVDFLRLSGQSRRLFLLGGDAKEHFDADLLLAPRRFRRRSRFPPTLLRLDLPRRFRLPLSRMGVAEACSRRRGRRFRRRIRRLQNLRRR